jgi:hypothetical protein
LICIKLDRASKEFNALVIKRTAFALLLILAVPALADSGGDALNERIPVNRAELEAHWQVDCASAWAGLQAAAARRSAQDHCGISAGLAQDIKLCAFIYQAPGENSPHTCPDYRRVSQLLERSGNPEDCPNLVSSIATVRTCHGAVP